MDVAFIPYLIAGGTLAAIYLLGRWILGPIDRAARARRAPVRLSIADFLCLFVAVQLPLTVVARMRSEETETYFWIFVVVTWIVAPVIWIFCAVAMSRAAVTKGSHRLIFMGLVLPVAYYGLIPFVAMAAIAAGMVSNGQLAELFRYPGLMILWAVTGAAIFACGLYTRKLVSLSATGQFSTEYSNEVN